MPSLAYALERRFLTVPRETPIWRAISSFDQPRQASIAIANSVVVRSSATSSPDSGLWILRHP